MIEIKKQKEKIANRKDTTKEKKTKEKSKGDFERLNLLSRRLSLDRCPQGQNCCYG